ncbi:MAG: hypothetical protein EA425_12905 [Puniceicoccaceae bacterium]|nr:MAG: hypothetical protein EA425_12905 [Puniceicoccaceae bacterium]
MTPPPILPCFRIFGGLLLSVLLLPALLVAQPSTPDDAGLFDLHGPVITRTIIPFGLVQPLFLTAAPGDHDRLFILEKPGRIRIYDRTTETLLPTPFLTVSPITTNSERGLLGLAFHPDFENNGYFFINYTNQTGSNVIRRYRVSEMNPNLADPASAFDLLTIPQDFANHNGGWIGFSPIDGYLYIAVGDGGSGNDPLRRAQNRSNLLGTIVRIDVDGDDFPEDSSRNYRIPPDNPFIGETGVRPEIWAYGLRNPWRCSFDRETGDLWIADVGQDNREEINFQPADSQGGENYGWRIKEGTRITGLEPGADLSGLTDPVHEYDFSDGRKSITGGYVYRGGALPHLRGMYFFADYIADFIRSFHYEGGVVAMEDVIDWSTAFLAIPDVSSFGEDAAGELYLVSLTGSVRQITQEGWFLWRNAHFTPGQLADPDVSGFHATPGNDTLTNLFRYAVGLTPFEPAHPSPLQTTLESLDGETYLVLAVERDRRRPGINFIVETTATPDVPGSWSTTATVALEDSETLLRVRDAQPVSAAERRFIRLRIIRP